MLCPWAHRGLSHWSAFSWKGAIAFNSAEGMKPKPVVCTKARGAVQIFFTCSMNEVAAYRYNRNLLVSFSCANLHLVAVHKIKMKYILGSKDISMVIFCGSCINPTYLCKAWFFAPNFGNSNHKIQKKIFLWWLMWIQLKLGTCKFDEPPMWSYTPWSFFLFKQIGRNSYHGGITYHRPMQSKSIVISRKNDSHDSWMLANVS